MKYKYNPKIGKKTNPRHGLEKIRRKEWENRLDQR